VNKSIGGDKTSFLLARIDRDLLSEDPDVVIIGLSLANEGIKGKNKSQVYRSYVKNMKKLIQICRKNDIIPVISNCYPNDDYSEEEYAYVNKFNEELSTWPVYSIDLMGAMDNGVGKWVDGYQTDAGHPNDIGHEEMTRAVPHSVFDGLIGSEYLDIKPTKVWTSAIEIGDLDWLTAVADRELHSNTIGFEVKLNQLPMEDNTIAKLGKWNIVASKKGKIYVSDKNKMLIQPLNMAKNDAGSWVAKVSLGYSYVRKELSLCINDQISKCMTTHEDIRFYKLGLNMGSDLSFRNAFWYYSSLPFYSITSIFESGRISKSSLALFAPLDDGVVVDDVPFLNLAPTELGFVLKVRE
jgi:hypothetical protein